MTADAKIVISDEEKTMYAVMQTIFESGIPISFKGSMVMKAFLIEAGYQGGVRHTKDIDGNWNTGYPPTSRQVADSIQRVLDESGMKDLQVRLFREYGEKRSVGIEVGGIRFCGVVPMQMIADKVASISSDRVFRRIKDVVDLYYLSQVVLPDREYLDRTLNENGRKLGTFDGFFRRKSDVRHAYEKFRFEGGVEKPDFEEVYGRAASFLIGLYPEELKPFAEDSISAPAHEGKSKE